MWRKQLNQTNTQNHRSWYLVYTKPKQERLSQENLQRQGYETYLPLIRGRKRRQGKITQVIEPMFSRYIFIKLNTVTDNWSPIRSTLGVTGIVRFGLQPTAIPENLIKAIKAKDNEEGIQDAAVQQLNEGDKVRIAEGPMYGYEGIFVNKSNQERVTILLDIIGKPTRVELCETQLERIS